MPDRRPDVLGHLTTRRTIPAARLAEPAPEPDEIATMLTVAMRVPDHGKLAPWRFVVAEGAKRRALADRLMALWREQSPDASEAAEAVERGKQAAAPLLVIVISCAAPHPKIPEWEQQLSAGAVCMNLIHAAHAMGYAGQWLTGWPAYDAAAAPVIGLQPGERVAGVVHIGTPTEAPVERDRPKLAALTTYWHD